MSIDRVVLEKLLDDREVPANVQRDLLGLASTTLLSLYGARRIWDEVLTDAEKRRLGDSIEDAWAKHGSALCWWIHLTGQDALRSVVELSYRADSFDERVRRRYLRAIGQPDNGPPATGGKPHWERSTGQLWFGGQVVREIRDLGKAHAIVEVLDDFQRQGWPVSIDYPSASDSDTLHGRIKSLNKCKIPAIKFRSNGKGTGIAWQPVGSA
jgi:hypothetical protein